MAHRVFTHRRHPRPHVTREEIIRYYWTYQMCYGDDVGQFLATYHRLWRDAHAHGVSEIEGIRRLARLLPPDWRGWAQDLVMEYPRGPLKSRGRGGLLRLYRGSTDDLHT